MNLAILALIVAIALAGPLLAWSDSLRVPVIVGELAAGVIVGDTGTRWIDPQEPTLVFLADIGFALVMFVSGSQVPVRNKTLVHGIRPALARLAAVIAAAVVLGIAVAMLFGTDHAALYAVLFASSSAAIVMPMVTSLGLSGPTIERIVPQVALADAACIVAVPLVLQPGRAGWVGLGALGVVAGASVVLGLLRMSDRLGWRTRLHNKSRDRGFALELRLSLLVLLLLAALAQSVGVSVMLAGFCMGLAIAAIGPRRRLGRQLFGLCEGLFGPIFFVWLGASLNLRDLIVHPQMIALGVVLGLAAIAAHAVAALAKLPLSAAVFTAAQIGVPVAAVTVGEKLNAWQPGEGAAVLLGALVTIAAATITGRRLLHASRSAASTPT